jgi:murein hydrolase activator
MVISLLARRLAREEARATRSSARATLIALVVCAAVASAARESGSSERARVLQREIERLEGELGELGTRESGVLGELGQIEAEIRLRRAQVEQAEIALDETAAAIEQRTAKLEALAREQARRASYLSFRLREIYKDGPYQALRRVLGGADDPLAAQRYAAHLSSRDARVLAEHREAAAETEREREAFAAKQTELGRAREEAERLARALAARRDARERVLESIRDDRATRTGAIEELEGAAEALDRLADSLAATGEGAPKLDVRKFRGLLDWPAAGRVSEGFGTRQHPRFHTKVPHPGLDIDAPDGADIRSVFDGVVVFASWMRGYGLTAIVDHGQGLLSIYAHASVLLVEPGTPIARGESLGKVGDSGSLRGPFLYLELREQGSPVDPLHWLRPRG